MNNYIYKKKTDSEEIGRISELFFPFGITAKSNIKR